MKNLYLSFIILLCISSKGFSQDTSANELKANKYIFNYNYTKAIKSLSEADELTVQGKRILAMSYHKLNKNLESDSVYKTFMNSANGVIPEDYFNYAMVLKSIGNISQSIVWMDRFSQTKPLDLRAQDYVANKKEYQNWIADNKKVSIIRQSVNTSAEEFGPTYYKDQIVFTSSRPTSKIFEREDNWHNEPYLDLYVADIKNEQLDKVKYFNTDLNGKYHDGPASFNKEGTLIAFTRNNYNDKSKDRVVELQIFFSNFKDDKWSEPTPFNHNNTAYSVGHPCLTADGNTMYFTCDMAGGYGGSDIYKTERAADGTWNKPINLGNKINTESDELFPFYEERSQRLIFTSDGHYGVGGLDIFVAQYKGMELVKVSNAGFPINTQFDDFSAIVNPTYTKGFFATNRNGSDDIYSFSISPPDNSKRLQGYALEKQGKAIPNATITLNNENAVFIDSMTTTADGAFWFDILSDKNYKLLGSKIGYKDGTNTASSFGTEPIIYANVTLGKDAPTKIEPKTNLAEVIELQNIYFDLDKSDLRPEAKVELDKVVQIMNENPEMIIALSSHTDCRASKEYNQRLSERRAKASVMYIKSRISNPKRITGKGHGEATDSKNCPCEGDVISDCSDADYQAERNTEFVIMNTVVVKK